MLHKLRLLTVAILFSSCQTFAQIYDGKTQTQVQLHDIVQKVKPGTILFLGESHGIEIHRDQHLQVLNALRSQGFKVSVGLEFVNYTDQNFVQQYREGTMDEVQFLKSIQWKGISFDFYKQQLNFPIIAQNEFSIGLNIPKFITSQISKNGLASLSPAEAALLPPQFSVGGDLYKQRFLTAAGAHCPNPENCFVAQSAWDDTMAWQAVRFIQQHPEQVLVIVVGEFHVQYGGGTPARVRARFPQADIVTLSQTLREDISSALWISPAEGPRADFIWLSR